MDIANYYEAIWPVLRNSFGTHARFFIATHKPDLLARGWNPYTHPLVEVLELPADLSGCNPLRDHACRRGYELFLPIVGRDNRSLLAPFDYEIFLDGQNHRLYTEPQFQQELLVHHIKPLSDMLENFFMVNRLPYVIDYTPSGFHHLFLVQRDTPAWQALSGIGHLEQEMLAFIQKTDPGDVKRKRPVDFTTASVFAGLGRLADYISLWLFTEYNRQHLPLPATICDSLPQCVNIDESWAGDSAIMRCLRTLAGAHRKNNDRYGLGGNPLVDVIYSQFDGETRLSLKRQSGKVEACVPADSDLESIVAAMWNLPLAASISSQYSGNIPDANDAMSAFVERYRRSPLYAFHQEFDAREDLEPGEGIYRFFHDPRLNEEARNMLYQPVPCFLQPMQLRHFVAHCLDIGWHPKHIGNGIRDIYRQNQFNFPFHKYPPATKANFYARIFTALYLVEQGKLAL
jgi:hypothetical protein